MSLFIPETSIVVILSRLSKAICTLGFNDFGVYSYSFSRNLIRLSEALAGFVFKATCRADTPPNPSWPWRLEPLNI